MNSIGSASNNLIDRLIPINELSIALNVSVGSIYYYVSRNEIPFIRVGRHLRFNLREVIDHFARLTETSKPSCRKFEIKTNSEQVRRSLKTRVEDEAVLKGD